MLPPSGWQHSICPLGHLGYTFKPVCIVGIGPLRQHPTPTHRLPHLKTFGNHNERPNYPPNVFSPEQQLEIDRQISIRLQEIELAKAQQTPLPQRNPLVEHCASPRVEPASVGSTTNKRGNKQAVLNQSQLGDSAPLESQGQHQKSQHVPYHQQTTPVSRKPKKGQQNQRHTQWQTELNWDTPTRQTQHNLDVLHRQTQHNWDTQMPSNVQNKRNPQHHWDSHVPAYVPQHHNTGQRRGYQSHQYLRQNYSDECNPP